MKRLGKVLAAILAPIGVFLLVEVIWEIFFSMAYSVGIIIQLFFYKKAPDILRSLPNIIMSLIQTPDFIKLATITGELVIGILLLLWYLKLTRFEKNGYYKKVFTAKNILIILILGIGAQFFTSGGMTLLQPLLEPLMDDYAKIMESIDSGSPVLVVLLVVFVGPFAEEMTFRGVMMKKLGRILPFAAANILQAAAFGIFHLNILQGTYAFLLGMILGYTAHRYQSIAASILLHMAVNCSGFLLGLLPDSMTTYINMVIAGGIMILVALKQVKKVNYQTAPY